MTGAERVLTAVTVAVRRIRADPMVDLLLSSVRTGGGVTALTESQVPAAFATELGGLADDHAAAEWMVRLVLSLLVWPGADEATEQEMLRRFVVPAFSQP